MLRINDNSTTSLRLFLVTIGALILTTVIMAVISTSLVASGLFSMTKLPEITSSVGGRQGLRAYVMLSNLVPFTGSALLALWFIYRARWREAAGLTRAVPPAGSVGYSALFFVIALPFVGWLAYLNLQVPLPAWMERSEQNTDLLLKGILQLETLPEFLLAFLTVAVTPAIGEELLLRGVVQRRVFRVWFGNPHSAIWAAAVLFTTMHFEFAGFAPRLLLGALLGYAYYWSRSLWVPIGLHLLFNGLQVIVVYVTGEFDPGAEMADVPSWWLGVASMLLLVAVGFIAEQKFGERSNGEEEVLGGGDAGAE
jgi:hypothetical protein